MLRLPVHPFDQRGSCGVDLRLNTDETMPVCSVMVPSSLTLTSVNVLLGSFEQELVRLLLTLVLCYLYLLYGFLIARLVATFHLRSACNKSSPVSNRRLRNNSAGI